MRARDQLMVSLADVVKLAGQNDIAKHAKERGVDLHWPTDPPRTEPDTAPVEAFDDLTVGWFR